MGQWGREQSWLEILKAKQKYGNHMEQQRKKLFLFLMLKLKSFAL